MIRLNLGSGGFDLPRADSWSNWDEDPETPADRHLHVPPIPLEDDSVTEIYCGHLLEHLEPREAHHLLQECLRVLVPGGRLGVVVPDTRAILEHYLRKDGERVEVPQGQWWELDDLDDVCAVFLYSTIQPSRHKWSYDGRTLTRALERAGFGIREMIDRWRDPRASTHNWYSLGIDAYKPEVVA